MTKILYETLINPIVGDGWVAYQTLSFSFFFRVKFLCFHGVMDNDIIPISPILGLHFKKKKNYDEGCKNLRLFISGNIIMRDKDENIIILFNLKINDNNF